MIVVKFGGTSVADAAAIARAAAITRSRTPRRPVIVVSALARATNELLAAAEQAAQGQLIVALRGIEGLRDRHLSEAHALLGEGGDADDVRAELSAMCDELASLSEALSVLGHLTPRSLDAIAAYGELLSAALVHAAFRRYDLPVDLVDARDVMVTDELYTRAVPDLDAITERARRVIAPMLAQGRVPVVGGFIGRSPAGVTTTIGRGGGDFSAALLGAALGADAIEIWTDVDGMLTADPRVVSGARLIEEIRFDEAAELATFGAKVLHPSTIAPAVQRGIPVFIFNSRRPEGRGTRITADAPRRAVSAIAGKGNVTVIKVSSSRMLLAPGFLRTLFEVFERHHTSVDVVATSEVSVSVTVDDPSRLDALLVDLRALGDVSIERQRAVVAMVGAGLGGDSATMARALGALHGMRVHMISLSATEINLTIIIDGDRLGDAMRALHAEFFDRPEAA
ncbi:MAG TPA: lysine-sensitive aspartokinase 3 [Gemmatimonadaceae bacterium]|nr:lysine-sensitive aspartokinase 3 [Gemmatimonadaceae bacterium]